MNKAARSVLPNDIDGLIRILGEAATRDGPPSSDYDLNSGIALPERRRLRASAVLIAVTPAPTGPRLYLTKRSSRLKHHPGQVALPGGKVDDGDDGPISTALREAREEIGLPEELVKAVGILPPHETVTGFSIVPVLGVVSTGFPLRPEPGEVDEVFTVPLSLVADPDRFTIERRLWRGLWRSYYTVPHGPYYIWGATARILRALAGRMPR